MPVSTAQSLSFDGRLTFAVNLWIRKVLADVFLGHNPLFVKIKEKGNVRTGALGPQLIEPIMIPQAGGPEAVGITDPYTGLTHLPMQGMTSAYYTPAEYGMPVSVAKRDMKLLTGAPVKKVDYVEQVLKKAMVQFFSKLNTDFWAAEASAGSGGNAPNVLGSILTYLNRGGTSTTGDIAPLPLTEQLYNGGTQPGGVAVGSGTPVTLVGGIERNQAENGYWCTPVSNPSSPETLTLQVWNSIISRATRNTDVPDLGWIHRVGFDKLVTILQGAGFANIFDTPKEMKKFSALHYRGVSTIFDDSVPSVAGGATSYQAAVLNTDYFSLQCDTLEPEMERRVSPDKLLMLWMGSWYGQITSGHLGRVHSRHAKLAN